MSTFIVRFFDLDERTKEEFEYSDLLSALEVIKNTDLEGSPAMSNQHFEKELIHLLTSGFALSSDRKHMIQLFRSNNEPVYGPLVIPFVAGTPMTNNTAIPAPNYPSEMWIAMQKTPPVANVIRAELPEDVELYSMSTSDKPDIFAPLREKMDRLKSLFPPVAESEASEEDSVIKPLSDWDKTLLGKYIPPVAEDSSNDKDSSNDE